MMTKKLTTTTMMYPRIRFLAIWTVLILLLIGISMLSTVQCFSLTSFTSYCYANHKRTLSQRQRPIHVAQLSTTHNNLNTIRVDSKLSAMIPYDDDINSDLADQTSSLTRSFGDHQNEIDDYDDDRIGRHPVSDRSRRVALQSILVAMGSSAIATSQAIAGVPEVDSATGELYTPKAEMLSGGSAAARGVSLSSNSGSKNGGNKRLQPGEAYQTVYETRFLAYLSRFLLNYDPAANAWWVKNGISDTWDRFGTDNEERMKTMMANDATFAEFAESVEIGLADYFVGPYGSYSSLAAMKAGITAAQPAKSARPAKKSNNPLMLTVNDVYEMAEANSAKRRKRNDQTNRKRKENTKEQDENIRIAKQGILNLYTLLKARYQSASAKRQLAILFTFISNPKLQPTAEIRSLLGEVDNANVTQIDVVKPMVSTINEATSRTSSRRGGGYSITNPPQITIDAPPALGTEYQRALVEPVMRPTTRVLKIKVTDGGSGYTTPPEVTVSNSIGVQARRCEACAILDREGHVDSIIVLDPGWGYGKKPPKVTIAPPKKPKTSRSDRGQRDTVIGDARMTTNSDDEIVSVRRVATAVAELEYEIVGIDVLRGGNGFVSTEPPKVTISPPEEDPDWYVEVLSELAVTQAGFGPVRAEVTQMRRPNGDLAFSIGSGAGGSFASLSSPVLRLNTMRMREEPLELLPSTVRPVFNNERQSYSIPYLPPPAASTTRPDGLSQRYREVDPLFGAIGAVPVTKGALELKPSEYARLALSGALCTVLVRTALNPLELIKTKLQLKNDEELFNYAKKKKKETVNGTSKEQEALTKANGAPITNGAEEGKELPSSSKSEREPEPKQKEGRAMEVNGKATEDKKKEEIGTVDLIKNLIELRGPFALFQSADITFLASLVFGSFGFGATELFRRSFSMAFFTEPSDDYKAEIVLLLAATVATIITSAAAAPFELLRVRSMGLVEPKKWTDVLEDFLAEKGASARDKEMKEGMIGGEGLVRESTIDPKQDVPDNLQAIPVAGVATMVQAEETHNEELKTATKTSSIDWKQPKTLLPLWAGFAPTASRELAFAIPKFLAFDIIARTFVSIVNSQADPGALPVQVGVGTTGLIISAFSGALAGIAGAVVSHPADLILTYTSASSSKKKRPKVEGDEEDDDSGSNAPDWKDVVKDLTSREGGLANLFLGLPPRLTFFFLVIGLQFFLYDYVKNLLQVGSDDLSLVLDVFYAIRQGLINQ